MPQQLPTLARVHNDIVKSFGVVSKRIFLGRPRTIADSVNEFLVIELPTDVRERVAGGRDFVKDTIGIATLCVRAKTDGTMNVNRQSEMIEKVLDLFPIIGEYSACVQPYYRTVGYDGHGFFVTHIYFQVRFQILSTY